MGYMFFSNSKGAKKNFFHKPLVGKNMALLLIDWGSPSRSQSGKYYGNTSDLSSGTFSEGGGGPWL